MNAARAPLETPAGPPPDSSPGGAWTAASLTPPALPGRPRPGSARRVPKDPPWRPGLIHQCLHRGNV